MNPSELLAAFQADESAVQQALHDHGIISPDPHDAYIKDFPPILKDACRLSDDALCLAITKHLAAGEDPEATPADKSFTPLWKCFSEGKLASMRLLLRAGVKTRLTADQKAIALGEVPASPDTGDTDPFLFACRVGNLGAAKTYGSCSDAGQRKDPSAVIEAVNARSAETVAWLLEEGFDPNAIDEIGWGALERAVDGDDVAVAGVLLAAGANPFGSPERDYASPVAKAVSESMRALFVQHGVNPARFEFATNPEGVAMAFLPVRDLTEQEFAANRSAREGRANPERFLPDFWSEQMRTGRYSKPKGWSVERDRTKPIWSFHRYGRSATTLPNGRLVLIGGEHEDYYDPDFCIYADVTVLGGKGAVDHYIYPEEVFPPTDFHSATFFGDHIWLIGALGYPKRRREGVTPVLRLDLSDFSIHALTTTGDVPGWIHRHRAVLDGSRIILSGGKVEPGYRDNQGQYALDLQTLVWQRLK